MKKRVLVWLGVAGAVTLGLIGTAGAYQLSKRPLDLYLHRLTVMGEAVSVSSVEELVAAEQSRADAFVAHPLTWTAETGSVTATPADLGLSVDVEAFEAELERMESSGLSKLMLYFRVKDMEVPAEVDEEKLRLAFEGSGIEQGMKDAAYFYEKGVQIEPHQTGYGIEFELMNEELQTLWAEQTSETTVSLPMRTREAEVTTEWLTQHVDRVTALVDAGLTLQDSDGSEWSIPLKDHLDWILPSEEAFTLNDTAFYTYVRDEIAPEVEVTAQPVVITEVEGDYEFEGSARNGRAIDYEATLLLVQDAINADPIAPVTLVVNEVAPTITVPESLALKGVTDLLGYGYSDFKGSPTNRIYNVNRGMSGFSGTLLAPGEEFSFTSLMGPIDAANGWYPELVIKGDETIPEYGGGLCQVSSTMFRAALLTGMPITARKNHSYAVSYYAYPDGYGLDATIYDPSPDFRFVNDTGAHLLIQGYTEGTNAYFVFYGTNDGRSVTMEKGDAYGYSSIAEPQIIYTDALAPGERRLEEYAHTGFKIDWWRTINYADGTSSERENFHSNYEARPAKYLEGAPVAEEGGV